MSVREFIRHFLLVLLLSCVACSSKQPANESQPLPSSADQGKTAQASGQQGKSTQTEVSKPQEPTQQHEQKTITYAKNPERFVRMETTEPAFNITNPKTAQEHFNVGVYDDNKQQLDKAIEEYQKALELQPDWALAHFRLAQDYQKKGRTDDAIVHWEQATRYDPQFYTAYDLLAGAYQRQGNLKKAIEAYSGLLKYPPAQMPAHYQLGLWYAELGDRQGAREHLQSYRELALKSGTDEPNSKRFRRALRELQKIEQ
jgi:tetratricopeptide (TPR) repeat protein